MTRDSVRKIKTSATDDHTTITHTQHNTHTNTQTLRHIPNARVIAAIRKYRALEALVSRVAVMIIATTSTCASMCVCCVCDNRNLVASCRPYQPADTIAIHHNQPYQIEFSMNKNNVR